MSAAVRDGCCSSNVSRIENARSTDCTVVPMAYPLGRKVSAGGHPVRIMSSRVGNALLLERQTRVLLAERRLCLVGSGEIGELGLLQALVDVGLIGEAVEQRGHPPREP